MATDLVPVETRAVAVKAEERWSRDEIDLIKRTVAKGTSDDEFKLFLYQASRTGLDPLAKQIHAIKRWDSREQREVMAIQTGIDGYRLIADRTGRYAPGREPSYADEGKPLFRATAYVKKLVGGTWHEVAATAFFSEYVQTKKDGNPSGLWAKMPHGQLAKCAEALALRKAFPAEMSGVYVREEMEQVGNIVDAEHVQPEEQPQATAPPAPKTDAPKPTSSAQPTEEPFTPTYISKAEVDQLVAAIFANKVSEAKAREIVKRVTGADSMKAIPLTKFQALLKEFRACGQPERQPGEDDVEISDADPETAVIVDKHLPTNPPPQRSGGGYPPCPKCGTSASVIRSKPEYGGGYVCYKSHKQTPGCGRKFGQSTPADEPGAAEAAAIFTDKR